MSERDIMKKLFEEKIIDKEKLRKSVLEKSYEKKEKNRGYLFIPMIASLTFVVLVNTSSSFANQISNVRVLSDIARVITFREYEKKTEAEETYVKVPRIINTGNSTVESRINQEIKDKLDELVKKYEKEARDYKEGYLGMGNPEENFIPFVYELDYEVYYSDEKMVSFVITEVEKNRTTQKYLDELNVPMKSEYYDFYTYNLDLETGKKLGLEDFLGLDYKAIIDREIERQVIERSKSDENLLSYYNQFYKRFGIEENQPFYINKRGNIVLIFNKYEIAPEYAGIQEYEVEIPKS